MSKARKQLAWSKLRVGLVVATALLILFVTVIFAGSIGDLFSPKAKLDARMESANGLRAGAPVWISGHEVGSVSEISLDGPRQTTVTLSVEKKYLGFIRKDAQASVLTMGLLGDKYVDLRPGSPEAPAIGPGDIVRGAEHKDMAMAGAESLAKISDVIARIDRLFAKIEQGEGTLARVINDPSLYNNLKDSSQTLAKLTREMSNQEGTISKLIHDPSLYDNLRDATKTLAQVSREMMNDEGSFRMLLNKPALYENLSKASGEFSATIEKINQANGIAGQLIADKDLADDVKETVKELNGLIKDVKEHPDKYFKVSVF
jgi:phospholipid/cholesterol/gamma-HCH transport system substrate-binding protein